MAKAARFYAESFAPWCERARWALDHHRVAYREIEQVPLVAEITLRVAVRRPLRRVTVPLLVDGESVLMDSDAIARHTEQRGTGPALFPAGLEPEITAWMHRSERLMVSGRAMLLPRMAANPDALREQLPPMVPGALRGPLTWISASGVRHLVRKYAIDVSAAQHHEAESRRVLDELRDALARRPRYLVGGELSYADITVAAALQFVRPVAQPYIALGAATREAWTHASLANDYADLLSWRDALYETCRRRRT